MNLEVGTSLTSVQLQQLVPLSKYLNFEILLDNDEPPFIIAVDNTGLICSCFEFAESMSYEDDGKWQLAHMNTLPSYQGNGLGRAIIQEAISQWGSFDLPHVNGKFYYVEKGEGFIRRCFDNGPLTAPPFDRP